MPASGSRSFIGINENATRPMLPWRWPSSRQPEKRMRVWRRPGQDSQQRVHRIVVDGKEQFLSQAELIHRAQIGSAIDNRLNEAKRILAAAKAERRGQDYPEFEERPQNPRHTTPTPGRNDRLRDIVEKIQIGDTDEGAQALEELVEVQAQAVQQRVQQQAFLSQNEREIGRVLNNFIQHYPDLAKDPGNTGMTVLVRTLKAELKRVPGVTDEQLAAIGSDSHASPGSSAQGFRSDPGLCRG